MSLIKLTFFITLQNTKDNKKNEVKKNGTSTKSRFLPKLKKKGPQEPFFY